MSESTLTTTDKSFPYSVKLNWNNRGVDWWNESCVLVLQVFGLPGHRFMYHPYEEYMVFEFKSKKDEDLCRILLSERL